MIQWPTCLMVRLEMRWIILGWSQISCGLIHAPSRVFCSLLKLITPIGSSQSSERAETERNSERSALFQGGQVTPLISEVALCVMKCRSIGQGHHHLLLHTLLAPSPPFYLKTPLTLPFPPHTPQYFKLLLGKLIRTEYIGLQRCDIVLLRTHHSQLHSFLPSSLVWLTLFLWWFFWRDRHVVQEDIKCGRGERGKLGRTRAVQIGLRRSSKVSACIQKACQLACSNKKW